MTGRTQRSLVLLVLPFALLAGVPACGAATSTRPVEPTPAGMPEGPLHTAGPPHDASHRFEHAEDWVRLFEGPERDAWQRPDVLVALLQIEPGQTVADVGTGTGYLVGRLSRAVGAKGRVLAEDVEPDMIRYVKERAVREGLANVEGIVGGADDPRLPAGSVDRVLVVDTWHHVTARAAFAKKLAAALRPGGFLAVVDFTMESDRGPGRSQRVAPDVVLSELTAAGLRAEIAKEELPEQWVVIGRK
jgi:ubiquinone/menaquinone biosynthesis C-methylase UbiE